MSKADPPSIPNQDPPLTTPPSESPQQEAEQWASAQHKLSLCLLVACPAIAVLPPRKLDLYTFGLATAWTLSLNQLIVEHSGKGMIEHTSSLRIPFTRATSASVSSGSDADRRYKDVQERLRREKLARAGEYQGVLRAQQRNGSGTAAAVVEETNAEEEERDTLVQRAWRAGEPKNWKEKRLEREKEVLTEGRGYSGLILDQIWDVWTWGEAEKQREREKQQRIRDELIEQAADDDRGTRS
ncbi:MAG: hypothetical protein M1825_003287 [Sarcosagium campestre]|nr:MAG: hypothetical protein M1825_003287 [Sarcosagium campestre]